MSKKLKLIRDYNSSPLWWDDGKEIGDFPLDSLPISEKLKNDLFSWQKLSDDYFAIMNAIPGGGWSYHTEEEFEIARKQLNIDKFPSDQEQKEEAVRLCAELNKELGGQGFEIRIP